MYLEVLHYDSTFCQSCEWPQAKKAEEYGSHDKTFIMESAGKIQIKNAEDTVIFDYDVEQGDILRMCQTKDEAIKDWVKLGITRAKLSNTSAVFWLDSDRPHDANLITKVKTYLQAFDTSGLSIDIMKPADATIHSCEMIHQGKDIISITGNVLRDYLTDLFPILELGTSAKMLSIVPLLAGGGLFETGAGGSAPKHVQQFLSEDHLRWDSLGEFLALAESLEDLAIKHNNTNAKVLAKALDQANEEFLNNNKSPLRKVGELDNRGSHFYLCLYWAKVLAEQNDAPVLKQHFEQIAKSLMDNEATILNELNEVQGKRVDIGGYYHPDDKLAAKAMRPSETFNKIIDSA